MVISSAYTNVAIERSDPDDPHAYIFDAAGMKPDFEYRDLATLEVTTILFNAVGIDERDFDAYRAFYRSDFLPPTADSSSAGPFTRNVLAMIAAVRTGVRSDQQRVEYALMVFDAALRQLSGLGIQPSPNKVGNPRHACLLAAWTSEWIMAIAPRLFAKTSHCRLNREATD